MRKEKLLLLSNVIAMRLWLFQTATGFACQTLCAKRQTTDNRQVIKFNIDSDNCTATNSYIWLTRFTSMKKIITLATIVILNVATSFSQCISLFSFSAYFETVTFSNQSSISKAHYFWNFGDGTSSYLQNPTHKFPETGNYLVTLFAKDTISSCSSYYEYWVNVTKYSSDSCQPSITDSVFTNGGTDFLKIIDNSTHCNLYSSNYDGGPALNRSINNWIYLGGGWQNIAFRMVCRGQYYDTSFTLKREAYKSSFHKYSSSHNYGDCSANFEFSVVSHNASGQKILFKAMNKTATYYQWNISGFGGTITSNNNTISQFYPFNGIWDVGLMTQGSTGCHDTIWQNILIRDSILTIAGINEIKKQISIVVYPNPTSDQFFINANTTDKLNVDLYDVNGRHVYSASVSDKSNINVTALENGIYTLTIKSVDRVTNKKLIIVR